MTPDGTTPETQADPQTHLDTDPVSGNDFVPDSVADPAHDTDEDEGWGSEGGATPEGPATDT